VGQILLLAIHSPHFCSFFVEAKVSLLKVWKNCAPGRKLRARANTKIHRFVCKAISFVCTNNNNNKSGADLLDFSKTSNWMDMPNRNTNNNNKINWFGAWVGVSLRKGRVEMLKDREEQIAGLFNFFVQANHQKKWCFCWIVLLAHQHSKKPPNKPPHKRAHKQNRAQQKKGKIGEAVERCFQNYSLEDSKEQSKMDDHDMDSDESDVDFVPDADSDQETSNNAAKAAKAEESKTKKRGGKKWDC
jgi:hypothetical protein